MNVAVAWRIEPPVVTATVARNIGSSENIAVAISEAGPVVTATVAMN